MISILGCLGWGDIVWTYICYIVWVSLGNRQVIYVYFLETKVLSLSFRELRRLWVGALKGLSFQDTGFPGTRIDGAAQSIANSSNAVCCLVYKLIILGLCSFLSFVILIVTNFTILILPGKIS